jgi:hypothetical protein
MKIPRRELAKDAHGGWNEFKSVFNLDGSLRDVYVHGPGLEGWIRAAQAIVEKGYPLRFIGGWDQLRFPEDVKRLFFSDPEGDSPVLSIDVGGACLMCHFFDPDRIEFDLNPSDIDSPERLDGIFSFMRVLASSVGKQVELTEENVPDAVCFRTYSNGLIEYMNYSD